MAPVYVRHRRSRSGDAARQPGRPASPCPHEGDVAAGGRGGGARVGLRRAARIEQPDDEVVHGLRALRFLARLVGGVPGPAGHADQPGRGQRAGAHADPVATHEASRMTEGWDGLSFGKSAPTVVQGADALLIVTEWKEFRSPDFDAIRASLKNSVIFDGRNLYQPDMMAKAGFEYYPIGRAQPVK